MTNLDPITITAIMFCSMIVLMVIGAPLAWALMISGMGSAYLMFGPGESAISALVSLQHHGQLSAGCTPFVHIYGAGAGALRDH